jgi:serine/threonine protein kinase
VLQAVDTELNRTVAIKVLAPTLAAHGPARKRFARESKAVAAVAHENVVAVHHVEGGGRVPYLVMQFIDGDSLQDLVIRDGPLDVTATLRITAQLGAALAAAHDQGLVHRDVKPANILVSPVGQQVWMTDFGLARAVDDASLTRTGFIAGTPHYMSPEQARGATVRSSSDLFGLGGVVYFMLTGRPPFRAERTLAILNRICTEPHRPVREVNPAVPTSVAKLVDRLLAKSAGDRFVNAEAVRVECLRLLANQASPDGEVLVIPDDEPSLANLTHRPQTVRRHARWTVIALLAVCIAVVIDQSGILSRERRGNATTVSPRSNTPVLSKLGLVPITSVETAKWQHETADAIAAIGSNSVADSYVMQTTADDSGGFSEGEFGETGSGWPGEPTAPPFPADKPFVGSRNSPSVEDNFESAPTPEPRQPTWSDDFTPPTPRNLPSPSGDIATPIIPSPITIVDESAVWQIGLRELEQALSMFETDLTNFDNQQAASNRVADHFDGTVRWIEATARDLNHEVSDLPATNAPRETHQ